MKVVHVLWYFFVKNTPNYEYMRIENLLISSAIMFFAHENKLVIILGATMTTAAKECNYKFTIMKTTVPEH